MHWGFLVALSGKESACNVEDVIPNPRIRKDPTCYRAVKPVHPSC